MIHPTAIIELADTVLARQLLSDEAPPCSSVLRIQTTLIFTWRNADKRLVVELSLDGRAHWRYRDRGVLQWKHDQDSSDGWPAEGKRYLMRFNRRAA